MNINQIDWDNLKYFMAFAQFTNLSLVAKKFGVKHTTVARRLAQLENELKVKLYHKLAKGWVLTDDGYALLEILEPLRTEVLSLEHNIKCIFSEFGDVKISAPVFIINTYLIPLLSEMNNSKNKIILVSGNDKKDIVNGEVDIALRLGNIENVNLTQKLLKNIQYGLYGNTKYISQCKSKKESFMYIGFSDEFPDTPYKEWFQKQSFDTIFKTNDMSVILQGVQDGLGLGILPDFLAQKYDVLEKIHATMFRSIRPLYLVMHSDIKRSSRVRLIADLIINHFEKMS